VEYGLRPGHLWFRKLKWQIGIFVFDRHLVQVYRDRDLYLFGQISKGPDVTCRRVGHNHTANAQH
jgi:hypothetical protein